MALENQTTADSQVKLEQQKQIFKWQNRLLPWLITVPSVLILVFIYLATKQANQFNEALDIKGKSVSEALAAMGDSSFHQSVQSDKDYVRWMALVKMEEESVNRRYHQGGLLLLSRIYIKYLGFLTGMIIAIVGAVFIIGKLSEDQTKMEGSAGEKIKFSIASSSPGILFGVLGTALMLSCIWQHNEVSIQEQPMFLNPATISTLKPVPAKKTVSPVSLDQLDSADK